MFQMLLKPLLGVAGDVVKSVADTKKAKAEQKVTEIKAKTELLNKQIKGEIAYDLEAIKGSKDSWKDEAALIVLLLPAVLVFVPFMTPHIKAGFEALHSLPTYYQHLLYIAISASFGIKGASGAMKLLKK